MTRWSIPTAAIACAVLLVAADPAFAQDTSQYRHEKSAEAIVRIPFIGDIKVVKPGRPEDPQPLVTTCSAGKGESCALFASNCLAANGYYDGDSSGGVCCSGVDHPDNNPGSACN